MHGARGVPVWGRGGPCVGLGLSHCCPPGVCAARPRGWRCWTRCCQHCSASCSARPALGEEAQKDVEDKGRRLLEDKVLRLMEDMARRLWGNKARRLMEDMALRLAGSKALRLVEDKAQRLGDKAWSPLRDKASGCGGTRAGG